MKRLPIHIICSLLLLSLVASCGQHRVLAPKQNPNKQAPKKNKPDASLYAQLPSTERRKRKRQESRAHEKRLNPNKLLKDMNYDELKVAKGALLEEENKEVAIKYLERMLVVGSDLSELKECRLELADLYFDMGDLERAESIYSEYMSFYPGSSDIEYVEYKTLLCCFYQTLEADRDQSKTQQSITLAENFLKKNNYKHYQTDVNIIQTECIGKLIDSEVSVFNFYLAQEKLTAAEQRLAYIKDHFKDYLHLHESKLLTLEFELAKKQGDSQRITEKQEALLALVQSPPSPVDNAPPQRRPNYAAHF